LPRCFIVVIIGILPGFIFQRYLYFFIHASLQTFQSASKTVGILFRSCCRVATVSTQVLYAKTNELFYAKGLGADGTGPQFIKDINGKICGYNIRYGSNKLLAKKLD
jgi:hypothetical protein